jgi:pilus assembly protein Flp/PilA
MNKLARLLKDESGVTAIEYGLIAAAIGLVLVAIMPTIGTALNGIFTKVADALNAS